MGAFATDLVDREVPIDAVAEAEFERWWKAEDATEGAHR
jgi:hypothetical protein